MLSRAAARRHYDQFGAAQDRQAFYEDAALDVVARHGGFGRARSVVEFGCGTGRFAERLLDEELPADATYVGFDQSSTMVGLTRERLERFGHRARVVHTDGSLRLDLEPGACDRFVSTYVVEILSESDQATLIAEARRLLEPGGVLCLTAIAPGCSLLSQAVMGVWNTVHSMRPGWVGGCRPMSGRELLDAGDWRIEKREVLSRWGIASEILVVASRGRA